MPSIEVGQSYDATLSTNDGTPIQNLVASVDNPVVSFSVPDPLNPLVIEVTGIASGRGKITYSCDNARPVTESVNVTSRPFLVVTDTRVP